jgi:hypothetical protein
LVAALALLPGVQVAAGAEVTPEQLQAKIVQLVADVKGSQGPNGAYVGSENAGWLVGQTALGVMALRAAGVPADDPSLSRAVVFLLAHRAAPVAVDRDADARTRWPFCGVGSQVIKKEVKNEQRGTSAKFGLSCCPSACWVGWMWLPGAPSKPSSRVGGHHGSVSTRGSACAG